MPDFHFYHPIEVRYGDLDPQGHVNNARFLTYMEQARVAYLQHLGLWDGRSFLDVGIILAEVQVTYKAPILFGQPVRVGVRVSQLGRRSLTMQYCLEDASSSKQLATGSSVLVAYDYRHRRTIVIPEHWRGTVSNFEELENLHVPPAD